MKLTDFRHFDIVSNFRNFRTRVLTPCASNRSSAHPPQVHLSRPCALLPIKRSLSHLPLHPLFLDHITRPSLVENEMVFLETCLLPSFPGLFSLATGSPKLDILRIEQPVSQFILAKYKNKLRLAYYLGVEHSAIGDAVQPENTAVQLSSN